MKRQTSIILIKDIFRVALHLAAYVEGDDEETVTLRRNIIRYMVVVQAMVLSKISAPVRKRYPNMEAFKTAGTRHCIVVSSWECKVLYTTLPIHNIYSKFSTETMKQYFK